MLFTVACRPQAACGADSPSPAAFDSEVDLRRRKRPMTFTVSGLERFARPRSERHVADIDSRGLDTLRVQSSQ